MEKFRNANVGKNVGVIASLVFVGVQGAAVHATLLLYKWHHLAEEVSTFLGRSSRADRLEYLRFRSFSEGASFDVDERRPWSRFRPDIRGILGR